MALLRALFFLALAVGEFYLLSTLAFSSPSFKLAAPVLGSPECFQQSFATSYPWLGPRVDNVLCFVNSVFVAATSGPRATQLLLSSFASLFTAAIAVATYEGFRPVHRRSNVLAGSAARASSLFLLAGQRLTAGFSTPLQLVFTTWSASSGTANTRGMRNTPEEVLKALTPESKYVWTTLLALVGGYLVPSVALQKSEFAYRELSIWQPFPLYILALCLVLPPVLSVLPNTPLVATVLITALVTVISVKSHYELIQETVLGSGADLRDVFLLRQPPAAEQLQLWYGAHILFEIDFVAVFITMAVSVLTGYGAGLGHLLTNLVPFAAVAALAGPSAAVIVFWAIREITLQRSYARAVKASKAL